MPHIQNPCFRRGIGLVIPANHHDLSVTTEDESAPIESGATDVFRPAGLIRACRLLLDGLPIPLRQGKVVCRPSRRSRPRTDEPDGTSVAPNFHQLPALRTPFQVKAGIQVFLILPGPRLRRSDGADRWKSPKSTALGSSPGSRTWIPASAGMTEKRPAAVSVSDCQSRMSTGLF
jgi:hypothetical protein